MKAYGWWLFSSAAALGSGIVVPHFTQADFYPALAVVLTTCPDPHQSCSADEFYNYDFHSEELFPSNVDWPVTMIFGVNATIDGVKHYYQGIDSGYNQTGSAEHALLNESWNYNVFGATEWAWDTDHGIKSSCFQPPSDIAPTGSMADVHMRLYAPNPDIPDSQYWNYIDHLYNLQWSNYVLGTDHLDVNESCSGQGQPSFGWSEYGSTILAYESAVHYPIEERADTHMLNDGTGDYPVSWWDGNAEHYHDSNGEAWFVYFFKG